ncbi:DNRLRE domain-containing protein [Sporomusa aerivorans]|uniref:DNRLRE domain-containing protein n=1 Tax=Sporomusa aerivorans TaxID=204936 RepID=UPI00352B92AE
MGFTIIAPPNKSTFVKQAPLACSCLRKSLPLGKNRHNLFRSLLQFDLSPLPPHLKILDATLNLYLRKNTPPCFAKNIAVHQILSKWCEKSVSFRHQPLINCTPASCKTLPGRHNDLVSIELTDLVQKWYYGLETNWGILLKMANEGIPGKVIFASRNSPHAGFQPYLQIEYHPASINSSCCQTLEITLPVTTRSIETYTDPLDTLVFNYTYIVVNTGSAPAIAFLQISPDGDHWEINGEVKTIDPGEQRSFVPDFVIKYSRLCYYSATSGLNTNLLIYVQGCT